MYGYYFFKEAFKGSSYVYGLTYCIEIFLFFYMPSPPRDKMYVKFELHTVRIHATYYCYLRFFFIIGIYMRPIGKKSN